MGSGQGSVLLTWASRGVAAGLVVALGDTIFAATGLPMLALAPLKLLGLFVASAAVLAPTGALLGVAVSRLERRGVRWPIPPPGLSVTVTVGAFIAAAGIRIAHRLVAGADVEFPGPVGRVMDAGVFGLLLVVAVWCAVALLPVARRIQDGRRVVQIQAALAVSAFLAVLHLGLVPIHDQRIAPLFGPAALIAALIWAGVSIAGGRRLLIAGGALTLLGAVGPCQSPGVRFVQWSRAAAPLPVMRTLRAAADWDGDGAYASWLGGTDCAPFDADIGPFRREIPGDGIDQDCRGGDPASPSSTQLAPESGGPWAQCVAAARDRGPLNVLLVTLDAVRGDALSPAIAPALGPFARGSAWFVKAYAPSTHTFGALPALLSGMHESDLGGPDLHARGGVLDHPQALVAHLKAGGYSTTALTVFRGNKAIARGFDEFSARGLDPPGGGRPKADYSASALTDVALDFLRFEARPPFFLWVHHLDPHAPYTPIDRAGFPAPDLPDYYRGVAYTALQVGRFFGEFAKLPVAANTVLALTSDHGEDLGERRLEGHGPDLYDAAVHVPLALAVPGCPGVLVDTPVSVLDLPWALAQLTGAKDPGYTLLDAVADPATRRPAGRPVVSEVYMTGQMRRAVVGPDGWKLIVDVRNGGAVLFDLKSDPDEQVDRYGDDAEATEAMEALYQAWLDRPSPT